MENIWTIILVVAVVVAFAVAWRKGYLLKLTQYVQETREELNKCSWPSLDELKGSTVVVMLSIVLLGFFTFLVDRLLFWIVLTIT